MAGRRKCRLEKHFFSFPFFYKIMRSAPSNHGNILRRVMRRLFYVQAKDKKENILQEKKYCNKHRRWIIYDITYSLLNCFSHSSSLFQCIRETLLNINLWMIRTIENNCDDGKFIMAFWLICNLRDW